MWLLFIGLTVSACSRMSEAPAEQTPAELATQATFTVTTTDDSGAGSLRQAILDANATPDANTITFGVSGTITLASTLPSIGSAGGALTIDGAGQTITVSGNDAHRVMTVGWGATLTVNDLTIANGNSFSGGGIFNTGTLTVTNSTFSANNAYTGGGIESTGPLTVTNSTFFANNASFAGGGIYANDDMYYAAFYTVTIVNSTFAGNTATQSGGAVATGENQQTRIIHSTITGNRAGAGGGVYQWAFYEAEETVVKGSIIAGNTQSDGTTPNDVAGVGYNNNRFLSLGHNLVGAAGSNVDFSLEFDQPGDQTNVNDPGLGALVDNGGPTRTHALRSDSPALDAIPAGDCTDHAGIAVAQDQRGTDRPQPAGGHCDVGAFELVQVVPSTQQLTVSKDGTGSGTVTSDPVGIDCGATCAADFDESSSITLVGLPDAGSGAAVWSGGDGTSNVDGTYTVSMTEARSVTATFPQDRYGLTVDVIGEGSVSGEPVQATYTYGQEVILTAAPAAGWSFGSWTGGDGTTNVDGTYTVTMIGATSVTATFVKGPTLTLSVTVVGTGGVTSDPAGIDCTAGTCSASFPKNTVVALRAQPADFLSWSGDASGDLATVEVTMSGGSDKAVKATFAEPNAAVLSIDPAGSFDRQTGTATVSGTLSCSSGSHALEVTLSQEQKQGRTTFTVHGSQGVANVSCNSSWTAILFPSSPADALFRRGAASVTVIVDGASTTQTVQLQ